MNISIDERDTLAIIAFEGNVTQEYVSVFRSRLADLIERGKVRIVLNMVESSYMSSMCLAAIVEAKNRTQREGGDVVMASVPDLVLNLLQITNLIVKFKTYATVEEAIKALTE